MRKLINGIIGDVIVYGTILLVGFTAGVVTSGKIVAKSGDGISRFLSWVEEHPEFLQKASADINAEPASEETDETEGD